MSEIRFAQRSVRLLAKTVIVPDVLEDKLVVKWEAENPSDAALLSEYAGRNCYQSWSNPAGRTHEGYIGHIIEQEHFSVLEHGSFSVVLEGVSRSLTHELVRHRHLSFSQLSQRYFDESNAEFIIPPLFRDNKRAVKVLEHIASEVKQAYQELVRLAEEQLADEKGTATSKRKRAREAARAVHTNNTETKIVVSGNHRSWREVFEKRGALAADAEIREVIIEIFKIARELTPEIYQDFMLMEDGSLVRDVTKTELVMEIVKEMERGKKLYGAFASTHEAYGVLAEEMAELLDAIRSNNDEEARKEAIQVSAVAMRLAQELGSKKVS